MASGGGLGGEGCEVHARKPMLNPLDDSFVIPRVQVSFGIPSFADDQFEAKDIPTEPPPSPHPHPHPQRNHRKALTTTASPGGLSQPRGMIDPVSLGGPVLPGDYLGQSDAFDCHAASTCHKAVKDEDAPRISSTRLGQEIAPPGSRVVSPPAATCSGGHLHLYQSSNRILPFETSDSVQRGVSPERLLEKFAKRGTVSRGCYHIVPHDYVTRGRTLPAAFAFLLRPMCREARRQLSRKRLVLPP